MQHRPSPLRAAFVKKRQDSGSMRRLVQGGRTVGTLTLENAGELVLDCAVTSQFEGKA